MSGGKNDTPLREADFRAFLIGLMAAIFDVHQVLIAAEVQTREAAIGRLDLHIDEMTDGGAPPLAINVLENLRIAITIGELSKEALARMDPAGSA